MLHSEQQGRKATWLSLTWHEIFFSVKFSMQGGVGALEAVPCCCQCSCGTAKTLPDSSCEKFLCRNLLPSLPIYSSREERLKSKDFGAKVCFQFSVILRFAAVKTFFKPKGLSEEQVTLHLHQACSMVYSRKEIQGQINVKFLFKL